MLFPRVFASGAARLVAVFALCLGFALDTGCGGETECTQPCWSSCTDMLEVACDQGCPSGYSEFMPICGADGGTRDSGSTTMDGGPRPDGGPTPDGGMMMSTDGGSVDGGMMMTVDGGRRDGGMMMTDGGRPDGGTMVSPDGGTMMSLDGGDAMDDGGTTDDGGL